MAVRIRLRRIGKKKQPQYRLVVAEAAGPRDGRFIEVIGHYNPRVDPPAVSVNEERALWWLKQGAQPTVTAQSMLVKTGVWERFTGELAEAVQAPAVQAAAGGDLQPAEEAASGEQSERGASPDEPDEEEQQSPSEEAPEQVQEEANAEESEQGR